MSPFIYHCFGRDSENPVSAEVAAKMITTSGIKNIPVNTHSIYSVSQWDLLPLGYGNATWKSVSQLIDLSDCTPVWNINHAQSIDECVCRARKAIQLGGKHPIKLEVLDQTLSFTKNEDVIVAAETLAIEDGIEVWPLIYPDIKTFRRLNNPECFPLVRIMGSGIGSGRGIEKENLRTIESIVSEAKVKLMLDGGISGIEDILLAYRLGFNQVLVNSCLFNKEKTPVQILESLVSEFTKANGVLAI